MIKLGTFGGVGGGKVSGITRGVRHGTPEGQSQRRCETSGEQSDLKKGPRINKCRGLPKLEKPGKRMVPCSFQVARGPGTPDSSLDAHAGSLTHRTVR